MANMKVERSLNPEAPEFLPNRNRNTHVEVPYLTSYLPTPDVLSSPNEPNRYFHHYHNPPSSYIQTYTAPPLNPCTSYPNAYLTRNVAQLHDHFQAPGVATATEPVPLWVIPDEGTYVETYLAGEETVEEPQLVVRKGYQRGAKRGPYRNRFFWRESNGGGQGFNGPHDSQTNKQEWRRKSNNGEYRRFRCNDEFSKNPRNVQYRAMPPKQRHPVLPVENDGRNTTVMIRNIPNKFTREMLMNFLDDHCMVENQKAKVQNSPAVKEEPAIVSAFDFLYLPIDFQNRVNKGYAFVNFTDPRAVWKFYLAAHNQPWGAFQSNKIREIACARLQGKEQLIRHFQKIDFPCEDKEEYLPVCFTPARDGSREKVNQRTVGRCAGAEQGIGCAG